MEFLERHSHRVVVGRPRLPYAAMEGQNSKLIVENYQSNPRTKCGEND
jgi:hypothetical protein